MNRERNETKKKKKNLLDEYVWEELVPSCLLSLVVRSDPEDLSVPAANQIKWHQSHQTKHNALMTKILLKLNMFKCTVVKKKVRTEQIEAAHLWSRIAAVAFQSRSARKSLFKNTHPVLVRRIETNNGCTKFNIGLNHPFVCHKIYIINLQYLRTYNFRYQPNLDNLDITAPKEL